MKRWLIVLAVLCCAAAAAVFFLGRREESLSLAPTVSMELPQTEADGSVLVPVTLNTLGDADYPAASFTIVFDPAKLEFLGLEEGTVAVSNRESTSGKMLPIWSCNADKANESGKISILYLDMTAGAHAFSRDIMADDHDLFFLRFRIRGAFPKKETLQLSWEDAVFAASDETDSLAAIRGTLKTVDRTFVVGE